MGVFFKLTDPKDFERSLEVNYAYWNEIQAKAKARAIAQEEYRIRNEWKKNRLFEINCSNLNCQNILEFVYDNRSSEAKAVKETNWKYYGGDIKGVLCSKCSDIQQARYKFLFWFKKYGADFCLIDLTKGII